MLTADQLKSIMPDLSQKRNTELLPFLRAAMAEFAIEPPARTAAFVAQLAHESGQFQFMEELWGPTDAQRRYEPPSSLASDLGNTETGDGRRFKGRGPIQITGRANYRRYGDLLRLDLVSDPKRAAGPDVAFRIAGAFWFHNGLNELADQATDDAFRRITKRINGGFNGLAERRRFYAAARTVLDVPETPVTRGRERATPVPGASEQPVFERGAEAIRTRVRRAPTRKAALAARKTKRRRKAAAAPRRRAAKSTAKRRKPAAAKSSRRKR